MPIPTEANRKINDHRAGLLSGQSGCRASLLSLISVVCLWLAATSIHHSVEQAKSWSELLDQSGSHSPHAVAWVISLDECVVFHQLPVVIVSALWCCLPLAFYAGGDRRKRIRAWSMLTFPLLGGLLLLSTWTVTNPVDELLQEVDSVLPREAIEQHTTALEQPTSSEQERQRANLAFRKLGLQSRMGLSDAVDDELSARLLAVAGNGQLSPWQRFEAARALLSIDVATEPERSVIAAAIRVGLVDTDPELRRQAAEYVHHAVMNHDRPVVNVDFKSVPSAE